MNKYDKIIYFLIYIYMILLPILPSKIRIWKIPFSVDIILALIIFLYLLKVLLNENEKKKLKMILFDFFHDYLCIFMMILFLIMGVSVSYAKEKGLALSETFRFLSYIVLFFIIKYEAKEAINNAMLKIFVIISSVLGVFGVIQFFTNIGLNKKFISNFNYGLDKKITSTLDNSNNYAAFLILSIFPIIMLVIHEKNKIKKSVYCLISVLLFINIVMTGSRNAYIGFIIGCVVLCVFMSWKSLVVLCIAGISSVFIHPIWTRLSQINDKAQNASRISLWRTAIMMIKDHPIFGVGNGNFVSNYDIYTAKYKYLKYEDYKRYPVHNSYLKVESELGIIGITSFLGMLTIIFFNVKKFISECENDYYKSFYKGFLASIIAFYFMNFSENLFFVPKTTTFFWILIAVCESIKFKNKVNS